MERNIVIFTNGESLHDVDRSITVDQIECKITGFPLAFGTAAQDRLILLDDYEADQRAVLLTHDFKGELRFLFHSRTFPLTNTSNPPRIDRAALNEFVDGLRNAYPALVICEGKQGKHQSGDPMAKPYELLIAILQSTPDSNVQSLFDQIWDWLAPRSHVAMTLQSAMAIHARATMRPEGRSSGLITSKAEIEALQAWNELSEEQKPPMDQGDEAFRTRIIQLIKQFDT